MTSRKKSLLLIGCSPINCEPPFPSTTSRQRNLRLRGIFVETTALFEVRAKVTSWQHHREGQVALPSTAAAPPPPRGTSIAAASLSPSPRGFKYCSGSFNQDHGYNVTARIAYCTSSCSFLPVVENKGFKRQELLHLNSWSSQLAAERA
ncbi:hypothetical protein DVH05_010824 [Phytophthora capsici]|nr:hypothetical protein DVH05_010824 [Phytophthora capsici]